MSVFEKTLPAKIQQQHVRKFKFMRVGANSLHGGAQANSHFFLPNFVPLKQFNKSLEFYPKDV
jgi:hypothetical protein